MMKQGINNAPYTGLIASHRMPFDKPKEPNEKAFKHVRPKTYQHNKQRYHDRLHEYVHRFNMSELLKAFEIHDHAGQSPQSPSAKGNSWFIALCLHPK
jgi:hypothetical protein